MSDTISATLTVSTMACSCWTFKMWLPYYLSTRFHSSSLCWGDSINPPGRLLKILATTATNVCMARYYLEKVAKYVFVIWVNWHELQLSLRTCIPMNQLLAHYTGCEVLPMSDENKTSLWGADSTQQTMLVVTHRLCRSECVDWRVQRRALSTNPLKTVHKYCRVTLCLSAALNLPALTRQLCLGNVLPSIHPDRPHKSWCIVVNV